LGDRHSVCLAWTLCRPCGPHPVWIGVPVVRERTGFHRPATSPASGPVRRSARALRPLLSTWRFRDRFSASAVPALPFRVWPKLPAFLLTFPAAGEATCWLLCRSLHLRFARFRPKPSWGVFSDTAAGIAARSRGLCFPFPFQRFPAGTSSAVPHSRHL